MPLRTRRFRGPLVAFAIAAVLGITSYVLTPTASYGAGGYPGPDALPGVPTYGSYLGTIPIGGHSPVSYVCGFDAPNSTNRSPKKAVASINGVIAAYLPISTQFGCAEFVVTVSATNGKVQAPCGYAYASVNGGPWILIKIGENELLVTGIKHYRHVGAYFSFYVPPASNGSSSCPPPTTIPTQSTIPPTTTPTTIPGQTTTSTIPSTSSTIPGFHPTTSNYNAGSTSTVPTSINHSPTTVLHKIIEVVTLIAIVVAAGAAAASAGELLGGVPEALVEEYTSEIPPGGGLPSLEFPTGGAGLIAFEDGDDLPIFFATTDMPPGGGYPVGGEVPAGTIADEYAGWNDEGDDFGDLATDDLPLFDFGDSEIPPGGGKPMSELSDRTGGTGAGADNDGDES